MQVKVRKGDTLWYYSQLFRVPFQLVLDSNLNKSVTKLMIGETVYIPGFITKKYIVQSGESFWVLSQRYNVSIDAIYLLNQSINPYQLTVGQTINLPLKVTWPIVQGKKEYDYKEMMTDLRRLKTVYPFLRTQTIGKSVMGKPIPEVTIGVGTKKVHANGSFHGNEWITSAILMTFLNDYLLAVTNIKPIRKMMLMPLYLTSFLSLVPMVDPDGVDLVLNGPPNEEPYRSLVLKLNEGNSDFSNWKANIRGVDLNNQFPAKWEIEQRRKPQEPAPRDYPGQAPLTEPEALAMSELTKKRNFDRVLAFHSQGEEIYWGYESLEPKESETIVKEFSRVSGYKPVRLLDSFAGYKDWFIQEWKRPGYTIEVGMGVNPLPLSQFEEIYEENLGILLASLYME
ncbi:M14 family metallopeptidase [Bacillus taeanensis]|uniref:Peptidase M14 n=1 Tax=Bacillus taeanensis TaxID=273032 RepID=A0A366XWN5_9BACI|nr:M14 family metallopeptidase [Bacillus taeanensis]RBW70562.1 peptidase M14 [Bacillus taeanensis]